MTMTAEQWLENRGLDHELAVKMGWAGVNHRELGPAIKIPYIRDGRPVTAQYRGLDAKEFRFAKGSEVELWNVDCLKDETLDKSPLIMAEGACDGLALVQSGFARTIAVPGWSDKNFDPDNYEPFKRNEEQIKRAGRIVVAQHADNAGAAMLKAVTNFFSDCDVSYVTWPKGCKDANDTLLLHGQEAVVTAVSRAREVDPAGGLITGFSDLPPHPARIVWRLDYPDFDRLLAFRSREISVLTGTPGAGKTTFMTWVTHNLVRANDIRIGLALFETDPEEVLLHLARLSGKQTEFMSDQEWAELKAKLDRNYRIVHRVEDGPDTQHGMAWLKSMVHKLAVRDNCRVIVIDPWNELEHLPEKGESLTTYTSFALMRMRQWAEQYDIHICIVAHPRKLQPGERPTGYHISDSAAWANKSGMGWTIHAEEDDEHGEHVSLTCWKVRSRQATGCRPGRIRMQFDETAMVYRPK